MPVAFLSPPQRERYGQFCGDPTPEQLARYFHLDDADLDFVRTHRGAHMRLGCAMQPGTVLLADRRHGGQTAKALDPREGGLDPMVQAGRRPASGAGAVVEARRAMA